MATETEKKNEQAEVAQQTYFELKPTRGKTRLINGEAIIEVTPNKDAAGVTVGNVTVHDNGMGVQVKKLDGEQEIPKGPGRISDDYTTAYAFGAAVQVTDGLTTVATDGDVILVNEQAEALAAANGTEPEAETETGIHLRFDKNEATGAINEATGEIDGKEFKIGLYTKDVIFYGNRVKVKAAAAPADAAKAASTDETEAASADTAADASTDEAETVSANAADSAPTAGKVKISLSKTFNEVVLEGLNGVKVKIKLGAKGAKDIVYTTGNIGKATSAADAEAEPGLEVKGDLIHLVLADGKAFDIDMATGNVASYVNVRFGNKAELDKPAPVDLQHHQIVISEGGTRLDLNKSSVEKTADGVAVATDCTDPRDGIVQIKPVDESPSAVAAAEAKIGQVLDNGFLFLIRIGDQEISVSPKDSGVMSRREVKKLLKNLIKDNEGVGLPKDGTLALMFAHAAKLGGFKTEGSYEETHYRGEDSVASFKHGGVLSKVGTWDKTNVRVVCVKPAQ